MSYRRSKFAENLRAKAEDARSREQASEAPTDAPDKPNLEPDEMGRYTLPTSVPTRRANRRPYWK